MSGHRNLVVRAALRRVGGLITVSAIALCALGAVAPAANAAGSGAPYQDPNVRGYLGLCDQAGQQVTHGSIATTPFAWRVVSSQAAQAPYDAAGRTATLYAYQPRAGLPAGEWSGDALTASARYTNPAHPMTAATNRDDSLNNFIEEFRPVWDGFLQIRMYLGAPNEPIYSLSYPALDIKVTGNTWRAVGGGPVSCTSGKSESIETILLPASTLKAHHAKPKPHRSAVGSHSGTAPSTAASGSAVSAGNGSVVRADAATNGSRHHPVLVAVGLLAFALVVVAGFIVIRRRPSVPLQNSGSLARSTSEKGR
jgi:hypothetical protein